MKVLGALFAMVMIVALLAVAAIVQLVITLAPFILVALIVWLMLRARRPAHSSPPVPSYAVQTAPRPQYRVGAPTPAPGGWVMVPVWVAPTQGPPVINAEVDRDRH